MVDVRLITEHGRCYTTKPELHYHKYAPPRLQTTPSPTHDSSCSSPTSFSNSNNNNYSGPDGGLMTLQKTSNVAHLVKEEHTYFCNPETKEQMKAAEDAMTARIILRSNKSRLSLKRFLLEDQQMGKRETNNNNN